MMILLYDIVALCFAMNWIKKAIEVNKGNGAMWLLGLDNPLFFGERLGHPIMWNAS